MHFLIIFIFILFFLQALNTIFTSLNDLGSNVASAHQGFCKKYVRKQQICFVFGYNKMWKFTITVVIQMLWSEFRPSQHSSFVNDFSSNFALMFSTVGFPSWKLLLSTLILPGFSSFFSEKSRTSRFSFWLGISDAFFILLLLFLHPEIILQV